VFGRQRAKPSKIKARYSQPTASSKHSKAERLTHCCHLCETLWPNNSWTWW